MALVVKKKVTPTPIFIALEKANEVLAPLEGIGGQIRLVRDLA